MRTRRWIGTCAVAPLLCLTLFGAAVRAGEAKQPCQASVSPFQTAPSIDGTLGAGEWDGALHIPALMNYRNATIVHYRQEVYFGFDKQHLYFAIVSELPPDGQVRAQQTQRDSQKMIGDDGIEIYIDPNRQNRAAGQGDRRFYLYHGNSAGAFLDIAFDIQGAPDAGWNGDWTVANASHADEGIWVQELRLPLADVGLDADTVFGREMGILVARNIKRGTGWLQCPWFPHQGAFVSVDSYPLIRLTKEAPTVALDSFGGLALHKGPIQLKARIFNPGPAREARVDLLITSSTMPKLEEQKTIKLPAGGVAEYEYTVTAPRLHEDAEHKLELEIAADGGEETWLNYTANWTKAPENRWPGVAIGPQPDKAYRVGFYPSHDLLQLEMLPKMLELEDCHKAHYALTTSRGVTLLEGDLAWEGPSGTVRLELPPLLDDIYTVTVTFDGWDTPIAKTFERKHFVWENNNLGVTDKVMAPFTPMTVEDDTVHVVLRSYRVDGLGLWRSVKAAGNVSAGGPEELLAAPMRLVADGQRALTGRGAFTATTDTTVEYAGKAEDAAVTVETQTLTEVDGCMRVEMTLTPGTEGRALKRLHLDIPLVDKLMPLYHVCTTSLRFNPAGRIPEGEGRCWDTLDFPDGSWYGNFKPYIWLGAEERGLSWFADNDAGWVLNAYPKGEGEQPTPCVELIRKDSVLTMRVNLVQKPITIEEPRTIVFGLMASPGKPMPEGWRTQETSWMGSEYWGSDESFSAKYPRNADLSPLDMMMKRRLGQEVDFDKFLKEWTTRNFSEEDPAHSKSKEGMQKLLKVSHDMAGRTDGRPYTVYWEEFHSTSNAHPEKQAFWHEWGGGSTRNIVASYRDFAVWWGAEFVRRGMGLYFDNSFPMQAFDPLTTSAYRLPNGKVQPSAGIWARRAYLRRIWTVHRQWGDPRMPPLMMIHMTNTHILPYMVWNDSNLDLEWFYGDTPMQARYARDMLRTQTLGRQTGNLPFALARGSTPRKTRFVPNREEVGAIFEFKYPNHPRMPEFMLEFGYGQAECDVFNYWDEGYPIACSDDQVASILLRRGGKARLLLATWNGTAATVVLTPDAEALGFTVQKVTDVRAETALPVAEDGSVSLQLEGYGARLIDLE